MTESTAGKPRVWMLAALTVTILVSYVPLFYARLAFVEGMVCTNDTGFFLLLPLLSLLLMGGSILISQRIPRSHLSCTIHWVGTNRRVDILASVLLSAVMVMTQVVVTLTMQSLQVLPSRRVFFPASPGAAFLMGYALRLVVLCPFVEEVFWRGYVQDVLQRTFNRPAALLTQACLFAFLHLSGWTDTLSLMLLGLILGGWRALRGTLVPVIVAHMVWNGIWLALFVNSMPKSDSYQSVRIQMHAARLQELCQPPGYERVENADPHYAHAFDLLTDPPQGLNLNLLEKWPDDLPAETITHLREWISSNEQAIVEFETGARKPYFVREYSSTPFDQIIATPFFRQSLTMTSLLLARAWTGMMVDDDYHRSAHDIGVCYRFGSHLTGPRPLSEQSLGLAVRERVLRRAFTALERGRTNTVWLAALQSEFHAMSGEKSSPLDFSGQRLVFSAMVEGLFLDDGDGGGRMPLNTVNYLLRKVPSYQRYGVRAWLNLEKKSTLQLADKIFAYLESVSQRTPLDLYQAQEMVQTTVRHAAAGNALLLVRTDGWEREYCRAYRCVAMERAWVVAGAVVDFQLKQRRLPDELTQLVEGGYLDTLPSDPFSGMPFVYKKTADDFLLYSLGADFDDDDGARNEREDHLFDGDDVFWPPWE